MRWMTAGMLLVVVAVGCAPQYRTNFPQVKAGMEESQVREILGAPSVIVPAQRDPEGALIQGPRWQYGDNLSTWTTSAVFPDAEPDRVWIVRFDQDGRVISTRAPEWLDHPEADQPSQPVRRDIFEPINRSNFR